MPSFIWKLGLSCDSRKLHGGVLWLPILNTAVHNHVSTVSNNGNLRGLKEQTCHAVQHLQSDHSALLTRHN
jgi:hypothetical protein